MPKDSHIQSLKKKRKEKKRKDEVYRIKESNLFSWNSDLIETHV